MKIIKKKVPVTVYEERAVGFEASAYVRSMRYNHSNEFYYNYDCPSPIECKMEFTCNGQTVEVEFLLENDLNSHMIREMFSRDSFGPGRPPRFKISVEQEEFFEKKRDECRRKDLPKNSL